ncbi:chromosome partitioning protein ParB [Candidatus Saccharibacteria bacterium]|nr:MAG: chromosome partitioning protein ParB [Candidatus Saccharibacteria bacterium]
MAKKTGLGRGFDALIPTELLDESFDPTAAEDGKSSDLRTIKLSEIHVNADQPRKTFDPAALNELAHSIKAHGIVQPLVVTPRRSGGYTVVAGERRFRAAKLAGIEKLPALVRTLSAQHKLELSLIENLQREDLNAIETATAYLKLQQQFNLSVEEIGQRVGGKSASTITNTLRLLRLPHEIKEAIAEGKLTEGQARPLLGVTEQAALEIYAKIIAENWSARRIEAVVAAYKRGGQSAGQKKAPTKHTIPRIYTSVASRLGTRLGTSVDVTATQRGAGKLVVTFRDQADFERIAKLLESA